MSQMKCYDVVAMVTDAATKQFGASILERDYKKTSLRFICSGIDEFAEQNNAIAYEVDVNDKAAEITISVECEPFEVDEITDVFCNLIKCAKKISFTAVDDFYVRVSFSF